MQLLLQCLLQLCEKFHSSLQVSIPLPEVHLCNSENILSFGVCWCSLKKKYFFFDSLKRLMQKRTTRGMLRKTHTHFCVVWACAVELNRILAGSSSCAKREKTQEITKQGDPALISQLAVHATSCNYFTKQMWRHAVRQTGLDAYLKVL